MSLDNVFTFRCPCGRDLRAPLESIGKRARCPQCKEILQIPPAAADGSAALAQIVSQSVKVRPGEASASSDSRQALPQVQTSADSQSAAIPVDALEAAREAFAHGLDKKARSALDELLAAEPGNAPALFLSAQLHERQMQVDDAIRDYQAAARLGEMRAAEAIEGLVHGGLLDEARRSLASEPESALSLADRCLAIFPQMQEAMEIRAQALSALGRGDETPATAEMTAPRVAAAPTVDPEAAARAAAEAAAAEAQQASAALEAKLVKLRAAMGAKPDAVARQLEALLSQHTQHPGIIRTLGEAHEKAGRIEQAVGFYSVLEELGALDHGLIEHAYELVRGLGQAEQARVWLDRLIEARGGGRWLLQRARAHVDAGDLDAAIEDYQSVWDSDADPAALFNLANCYFLQARYPESIEAYTALLAAHPDDRQALINRAACYRLLRPCQHGLAVADLRRADALA